MLFFHENFYMVRTGIRHAFSTKIEASAQRFFQDTYSLHGKVAYSVQSNKYRTFRINVNGAVM